MYHTRLLVTCDPAYTEVLIAALSRANFDSFLERDDGFETYVEGDAYDAALVEEIRQRYEKLASAAFTFSKVEKKNWNEEWEKSFSPVVVEDKCLIRASFHQADKRYPYEIVITPKMSFGTGHHQTTWLMVKNMLDIDHAGKRVMDAGCGTAILSILASRLGAQHVEAFDIDSWSVENGTENIEINQCANIRIRQGSIGQLAFDAPFDIILANINKNVLTEEMAVYAQHLKDGGLLLLSGFFSSDIPDLVSGASRHGLRHVAQNERDTWAALLLRKSTAAT